jgi:hypothetical protein
MTTLALAAIRHTGEPDGYLPGVCNIGMAEIRVRRIWAAAMLAATIAAFAYLLWKESQPAWMLLLFPLAMGIGVSWLQARERFCVNFGVRGRFNFGRIGPTTKVADAEARRRDFTKVRSMFLRGAVIAAVVTAAAFVVALFV